MANKRIYDLTSGIPTETDVFVFDNEDFGQARKASVSSIKTSLLNNDAGFISNTNIGAPLQFETDELTIALGDGVHVVDDALEVKVQNSGGIILGEDGISVDPSTVQQKAIAQIVTIPTTDWAGGTTCTKTVSGVTASNIVFCDASDASVECTAQATNSLTFTATATPTEEVAVKVVILP